MKIMSRKNSELGFTLVEMLAALVAAVVIIGAATGFMLTAAIRQLKVLGVVSGANRSSDLAWTMKDRLTTLLSASFRHSPSKREQFLLWHSGSILQRWFLRAVIIPFIYGR